MIKNLRARNALHYQCRAAIRVNAILARIKAAGAAAAVKAAKVAPADF